MCHERVRGVPTHIRQELKIYASANSRGRKQIIAQVLVHQGKTRLPGRHPRERGRVQACGRQG